MEMKIIQSNVPHHRGLCTPVWLNEDKECNDIDRGKSGFFKAVRKRWFGWQKWGVDFHGVINKFDTVEPSTREAYIADDCQRCICDVPRRKSDRKHL